MSSPATQQSENRAASPASLQDELLKMLGDVGSAPPPPRRVAPVTQAEPELPSRINAPSMALSPSTKAPADPETSEPKFATGCPDCGFEGSWGSASWCPKCGYYPAIGRAGVVVDEVDENEIPDIVGMIPEWVWPMVGGMMGIVAITGTLRYFTSDREGYLSLGSLIILSSGLMLALFAHASACYAGLKFANNVGPFSLIFNPMAVWSPVFKKLPTTSYLVTNIIWGLTAAVSAMAILGPIHMDKIREDLANVKKEPPKQSMVGKMVGATVQATQQMNASGPQPQNLDEAMQSFAGLATGQIGIDQAVNSVANGGEAFGDGTEGEGVPGTGLATNLVNAATGSSTAVSGNQPGGSQLPGANGSTSKNGSSTNKSSPIATPEDDRHTTFAIFGYLMNSEGEIRSLLLAHESKTRGPVFAARLDVDDINEADRTRILELFPALRANRSYTRSPYNGAWIVPRIVLDIEHQGWSNSMLSRPTVTAWRER